MTRKSFKVVANAVGLFAGSGRRERDNLISQLRPGGEQSRRHNKPTLCNAVVGTWSGYTNGYSWKVVPG